MNNNDVLTIEKLNEAMALIKALAPKQAPPELFMLKGTTGLNIVKNEMLGSDTIMVSKDLFDMLYDTRDTSTNAR